MLVLSTWDEAKPNLAFRGNLRLLVFFSVCFCKSWLSQNRIFYDVSSVTSWLPYHRRPAGGRLASSAFHRQIFTSVPTFFGTWCAQVHLSLRQFPKKPCPIFCQCGESVEAIWGLPTCEWGQHFHLQTIFLLKEPVRNLSLLMFRTLRFPSPPVLPECAYCLPFPMAGSEVAVSSSFLRQLLLSIHLPSHKLYWYPQGLWSSS